MAAIDQRLMKAHVGVVGAFDTKQLVLFFFTRKDQRDASPDVATEWRERLHSSDYFYH